MVYSTAEVFQHSRNEMQPPEVFCKKGALKNLKNFIGKYLCWNLFLIKCQAFRPATLSKRDSDAGAFQ